MTNAFGITGIQNVSSYGYDNDGNQITFTDPNNHTTTNVFDALNRQVQVQYPDGTKTSTGYDADGRSVVQTNQDGIATWFGYDGTGRLITVTNAASQVTRYQYDEAGNQTTQIDALNRTNTYAYDGLGRKISHTMPGGQMEGFAYDVAGNQIYQTNFNGAIITNQYNVVNRLTNCSSLNGYHVSFAYSPTGQRTNMIDAGGRTAYAYDVRDRLLSKAISWSNGPTNLLSYAYDANGNVTNIWSSTVNGVNLAYSYDPLNRLTNVLANGSAAAGYGFDLAGNLQVTRYGNGVTNLCQYDSLNRLTNLTWKLNAGSLANFSYLLGATGNRTNLTESVNGTNRVYAWQYDTLYRLTNENFNASSNLAYAYDPVGNRTNRTSSVSSLTNQNFTFNTNDWLTTDHYDNNGNTTNSSGNAYQYDVMNHLTNLNGTVLMTYDGDGDRVSKAVGGTNTFYLLDDRNPSGYAQVLEEWTVATTATNVSKVYNYGLNLISQRAPGVSTNYFVYDGHGSTRLLMDIGGNVVNLFAYDAYGTLIASNASPQTMYLYCGQQFDQNLGFYYNRARYLNAGTGRFWTADTTDGNNEDPLSLHKYLYAEADPVDMVDPNGHDEDVDTFAVAGSGAIGIAGESLGVIVRAYASAALKATIASVAVGEILETEGDRRRHFFVFRRLSDAQANTPWQEIGIQAADPTAYLSPTTHIEGDYEDLKHSPWISASYSLAVARGYGMSVMQPPIIEIDLTKLISPYIDYTDPFNLLSLTSDKARRYASIDQEVLILSYVPAAAIVGEIPDQP